MPGLHFPELHPGRSTVLYRSALIRSLVTSGRDVSFVSERETYITVELSDTYRATGIASGQPVDHVGCVGGVHVNPVGRPIDLTISGLYRAVQLAVPVDLAAKIVTEDHGIDGSNVEFSASIGKPDRELAKLLYYAATNTEKDETNRLMRDVIAHLLKHYSSVAPERIGRRRAGMPPVIVRRVMDFVAAHLEDLSTERMAAEAGLSPFHFAREFKRVTGETPWSYVTAQRLNKALSLLSNKDLPLNVVAKKAGFADASHLAHRMREKMSISPTDARLYLLP